MPGIIYKFENQNIQTFFDNMKLMGDLPFAMYFDFEATLGKKKSTTLTKTAHSTQSPMPLW